MENTDGLNYYFLGEIDDIRVYKRSLSESDIKEISMIDSVSKDIEPPIYPEIEEEDFNVKNLIVVVHGWRPEKSSSDGFEYEMASSLDSLIEKNIESGQLENNWNVFNYQWENGANTLLPSLAWNNAWVHGAYLALSIMSRINNGNEYNHIHFIAHSAGSNLINRATQILKDMATPPSIHATYLDAYYPGWYDESKIEYGKIADWAEQYVDTRDLF